MGNGFVIRSLHPHHPHLSLSNPHRLPPPTAPTCSHWKIRVFSFNLSSCFVSVPDLVFPSASCCHMNGPFGSFYWSWVPAARAAVWYPSFLCLGVWLNSAHFVLAKFNESGLAPDLVPSFLQDRIRGIVLFLVRLRHCYTPLRVPIVPVTYADWTSLHICWHILLFIPWFKN